MNERCQFCIDPMCEGRRDCDCESCDKRDCCYRTLRPTIRVTLKCTQKCGHCCWAASPAKDKHMTPEVAELVHQFLDSNPIHYANIMGGEFWLNPDWEEVLGMIVEGLDYARLVTNGDWSADEESSRRIRAFMEAHEQCYLAITTDRWHTNKHVVTAEEFCKEHNLLHKVGGDEDDKGLVPVGRSAFDFGMYGMLACYCHTPVNKYTFLIDEDGTIYKCAFGTWDYDRVHNFVSGGFPERFKEFNEKFYGLFVGSCTSCRRAYAWGTKRGRAQQVA